MMTEHRFFQILEAYGTDPARWPADERAAAEAFARAHAEQAGAVMRAESALDDLLDQLAEPARDDAFLERRLLAGLPVPAASRWMAPTAVAAALLLGVCLGFASGALTGDYSTDDVLYADAFTGYEEDWVEWLGEDA